jgi:voltage-gated potassium channel
MAKKSRFQYFLTDVMSYTPLIKMVFLLLALWLAFSTAFYVSERGAQGGQIISYTSALYWGVAAFSTAGIADTPKSSLSMLIGGIWIVLGSGVFFGTIVATITTYFLRPLRRPVRQIVDTIEYNLEQLEELSVEELDLLKNTVDSLIVNMEKLKQAQTAVGD